jgi:hypothetical protein
MEFVRGMNTPPPLSAPEEFAGAMTAQNTISVNAVLIFDDFGNVILTTDHVVSPIFD